MLRWRLLIGAILVAALAAICRADARAARPGAYLAPVAFAASLLAAGEMLRMGRTRHVAAIPGAIYAATALPVLASFVPIWRHGASNLEQFGWLAAGLVAGLAVVLVAEMRSFDQPGGATNSLALGALSVLYVGGLLGTLVQVRLVRSGGSIIGLTPLATMIAAVKLSDTCQYFVGKSIGRTKLAPRLSPGKTWEGTIGGIGLAVAIAALGFPALVAAASGATAGTPLRWAGFTLTVAIAGLVGDLGESLLKRDAGVKDSSDWLPGFGGVLDLLDSLLLAAPVAYLWWACGGMLATGG